MLKLLIGQKNLKEWQLLRRPLQTKPAGLTRGRIQNARTREVTEDLGEVLRGDTGVLRDTCTGNRPILFALRQVDQCPQSILAGS